MNYLTAFCSSPYLYDYVCQVTPAQLMRPGIGQNKSCVLSDFLKHDQNVVCWLLVTHRKVQTMFTNKKTLNSKSVWEVSTLLNQNLRCLVLHICYIPVQGCLGCIIMANVYIWNVAKQVLRKIYGLWSINVVLNHDDELHWCNQNNLKIYPCVFVISHQLVMHTCLWVTSTILWQTHEVQTVSLKNFWLINISETIFCCIGLLHASAGLPWLHDIDKDAWNVAKLVFWKKRLKKPKKINLEEALYCLLIMCHTGASEMIWFS